MRLETNVGGWRGTSDRESEREREVFKEFAAGRRDGAPDRLGVEIIRTHTDTHPVCSWPHSPVLYTHTHTNTPCIDVSV